MIDSNNGWLDVVAWTAYHFASAQNFTTLFLYFDKAILELFNSTFCVQRSNQSFLGHGITNAQSFICLNHSFHECIIYRLVKEDSSQSSASLTTSSDGRENTSLKCQLKICVWQNNDSVVTTELENSATKTSMDISTYRATDGS